VSLCIRCQVSSFTQITFGPDSHETDYKDPVKSAKSVMIYDIYLLQLGFHPVAVVGELVKIQETDSYIYKRRNNTKKIHKTLNTQNRKHIQKSKQI
jgi:hypothetical protein